MPRFTPRLPQVIRSVLFLSAITLSSAQAAEKIDLIIDTDPGAVAVGTGVSRAIERARDYHGGRECAPG